MTISAIQTTLDLMVDRSLERNGAEGLPTVVGDRGNLGLNLAEDIERLSQVRVRLYQDCDRALNVHHGCIMAHVLDSSKKGGRRGEPYPVPAGYGAFPDA